MIYKIANVFLTASYFFLVLASGCQMRPKFSPPNPPAPGKWKHAPQESQEKLAEPREYWWYVFDDGKLNELECQALENNKDLYAAFEKVLQARAMAAVTESDLFPQLSLEPNINDRGILYRHFSSEPNPIKREHRRWTTVPFVLSYELDLWGKLQQAYESASLTADAEDWAFQTSILMLTSDLALSYFHLRTLDADTQLLQETAKSRKKAYEIIRSRYLVNIINYSDVSRAELEYTNTLAQYYKAVRLRDLEENKIAVLLGVPATDFKIEPNPLEYPPPVIPAGLPSDILLQRPDIVKAEYIRASEHAMTGVAYASFFPSINLTGALGYSSPNLKDFLTWKSRFWQIAPDLFQVVFDAGRLQADLAFAIAKFREADDEYQKTVLEAFQEVEDALGNLEGIKKELDSIELSVQAAKTTFKIASDRYNQGITFYLDVVDSERQQLESQRKLIELLGQRYAATIQFIKAIGGAWAHSSISEKIDK